MIRVFPVPIQVRTAGGRCLARFAITPQDPADPWWVVYRDASGQWCTAMVLEPAAI
ncbi:hypothetical protein GWK16_19940 [Roseomonas sp. JC162]|uniref:Uncharacterized protein n=1 Tax=Neoroseomonas marina TaxID=1232220 RepID=A0A848EJG5_9PROT|nr:hypothetical protein [Neoroseomonas marina]NMJ43528.1 hypothetical protein [Neoroseomonas marina]